MALALQRWGWSPVISILPAAIGSTGISYIGNFILAKDNSEKNDSDELKKRPVILGIIIYLFVLRLIYIGIPDLIPEEAYYWNYAQHLDWGYLDHPPMVAWMIKVGTTVFGNTEFGVRIWALISWLFVIIFGVHLAKSMFDKKSSLYMALLLSVLPFFFGIGALMTPDAPLTACWAGTLYFLYRALSLGKKNSWFGAGICIGLGMLSKYTIALIIPPILLFILLDTRSRHWLFKPQPYLAAALAFILFAPVIYWNSQHNWASFLFQTARRLNEKIYFSPHLLLGSMLVLITPIGLMAAFMAIFRNRADNKTNNSGFDSHRQWLFILILSLSPLIVFTIFSLSHQPKINWTGPLWLAILPSIAFAMASPAKNGNALSSLIWKSWMPTIITLVLLYGAAFNYLRPGFPCILYPQNMTEIAGWKDLGRQIEDIGHEIEAQTGVTLLIVGMDKYNISSELAFYGDPEGPSRTAGSHLFGHRSLMYQFWFPESDQNGKTMLMVNTNRESLDEEAVKSRFNELTEIAEIPVKLNGIIIGKYFYRTGFGYKAR